MKDILNYIARGRGIGALFLLLFSFIVAFYVAMDTRVFLNDSMPYMQSIAEKFLPIKIENGKVIEPENTVKEALLGDGRQGYRLVLDTTQDDLNTAELSSGLYVTRSYFYAVKQNEIRSVRLSGNVFLPKQDYTPTFAKAIRWAVVAIGVGGTILLFLAFFVLIIVFAFCAGLAAVINKKELAFDVKLRLSTLIFIAVYLLSAVLGWVGFDMQGSLFFLLVIAAQVWIVKKLPR